MSQVWNLAQFGKSLAKTAFLFPFSHPKASFLNPATPCFLCPTRAGSLCAPPLLALAPAPFHAKLAPVAATSHATSLIAFPSPSMRAPAPFAARHRKRPTLRPPLPPAQRSVRVASGLASVRPRARETPPPPPYYHLPLHNTEYSPPSTSPPRATRALLGHWSHRLLVI